MLKIMKMFGVDVPAKVAEIRLKLEERVEPVRGRIGPITGPLEAFSGWIGLAMALDRSIRDQYRQPDAGDQVGGS